MRDNSITGIGILCPLRGRFALFGRFVIANDTGAVALMSLAERFPLSGEISLEIPLAFGALVDAIASCATVSPTHAGVRTSGSGIASQSNL